MKEICIVVLILAMTNSFFKNEKEIIRAASFKGHNSCDSIDLFCNQLVSNKVDTVILYKELNYSSGVKGLIVWKQPDALYGMKFMNGLNGINEKQKIDASNRKLAEIAKEYFNKADAIDTLQKSEMISMHDIQIIIQSFVKGNQKTYKFNYSQTFNSHALLAGITTLCHDVIYCYTD